jgi:SAM-dependent methyltransferase
MVDVVHQTRRLLWRDAAHHAFELRPMLLDQFRHEEFRSQRVLDVGTGEGRLAFVAAGLGGHVTGVDLDRMKLQQARAYAAVKNIRGVDFVWGDGEKASYREFSSEPFDFVVSNLCMSPAIVWHASRGLRPGGKFIFCCHHGDHWKETHRGSRWAFYEDTMTDLLQENRFDIEFMGVDTIVAEFDELREVELFLRGETVRKWVEDGRWEELSDSFARGEKHLTQSYLVAKARRLAHEMPPYD